MKYFLIAGEASGDLHAAPLITALRETDPDAEFRFLGGDLMAKAAGTDPVIHYREMAYMGFIEVLKHLRQINANFKAARAAIADFAPDRLILIDYPSFNLKMAKYAKKLGIKVVYYIPPKIWAWKEWRIKTIRRVVDRVLAIFPFEVDFYRQRGYDAVSYVGNPSVQEIDEALSRILDGKTDPETTSPWAPVSESTRREFIKANHLTDRPIIAVLPGSRLGEIRENLKVMNATIKQFPQYRGVVAGAPGVDRIYYSQHTTLPVVYDQTYELLLSSRGALVTSGTATLEAALIGTPQVALYQGGGSKMLYNIMKRLLKIPYVTLPNLIAGRQVIPELLMHLCTPDAAAEELGKILPDQDPRRQMVEGYADVRRALGTNNAPATAAHDIRKEGRLPACADQPKKRQNKQRLWKLKPKK